MKRKSERYQSRQKTPWDSKEDLTPTQKFMWQVTKEWLVRQSSVNLRLRQEHAHREGFSIIRKNPYLHSVALFA